MSEDKLRPFGVAKFTEEVKQPKDPVIESPEKQKGEPHPTAPGERVAQPTKKDKPTS